MFRKSKLLRRILLWLVLPFVGILGLLTGCQSKLLYFPRPYGPGQVAGWDSEPGTKIINYQTKTGPQQAYLLSRRPDPERLWLVCGGNGTLALEWSDWLRENAPAEDAWLMVDMPGYGACSGKPRVASIRENLQAVVPAAISELGWVLPADQRRLRFFGHSLGSAVSLMGAEEYDIQRGVLLSPFTSTMEMTKAVFGVNLGFIVQHRFDNRQRLKTIDSRGDAQVFIFHGSDDEVIPVQMARDLSKEFPNVVRYTEVPGGRHNTLQDAAKAQIAEAMRKARLD